MSFSISRRLLTRPTSYIQARSFHLSASRLASVALFRSTRRFQSTHTKSPTTAMYAASPPEQHAKLVTPTPEASILFVCDIQETFRKRVLNMESLIDASKFLVKAARTLNIPIIITEQKPFLPTVSEIKTEDLKVEPYKKSLFSMLTPEVRAEMRKEGNSRRRNVYICGLETHVCVLQTSLDLLREGYNVFVVVDAVSSQRSVDRETAIERLKHSGAIVTTAESAVYELMSDAQHPKFKEVLAHVKELAQARSTL